MDGRLAPVGCTPRHIDACPEGVVGQHLIQVVAVFWFKDGLGTSRSIGGTRGSLIHLQPLLLRQQRIGVTLIAVELEVSLSGRFADDEHHDGLLVVHDSAVRKFYLLSLFVLLAANHPESIGHVRPRL